jgi:aminoglycoside phosphotransferase (APT) family kinase protein
MSEPRGIEVGAVSGWLTAHLPDARPPFEFDLIAAGGSNLTFRVRDAEGRSLALRRPPLGARIATAHDVSREWRILRGLATPGSGVPVPEPLGFCEDEAVTGAPFYVMAFIDGLILRDRAQGERLSPAQCRRATESLVDTQIACHRVDLEAVGLADLGRHSGYVARQLARWQRQAHASKTREVPLIDVLHDRLAGAIPPESGRPGLAHGDYRFDNTVLGPEQQVLAVLDWELCTIGEPVADFCWSLLYWSDPGDAVMALTDPPTLAAGFPRRDEVVELYAERSGLDLSQLDYYMAFSWWKQACIVEGVYARFQRGGTAGMRSGPLEAILERVDRYLALADELSRGL